MAQKHILIICGEASGDLHAANVAKAIFEINPKIKISGVGGINLSRAGAQIIYDIKDIAVIGLFNVLKKLPKFLSLQKFILQEIKEKRPDAIILVDFSGFNLRLAQKINKAIPTIYYISPQVWASRQGRIKTIKKYVHKMIVLFKFEENFYRKYGIGTEFIGHPLLDIVRPTMAKQEFLTKYMLSDSKTTIALLPGSRRQEIENILPIMLKASVIIDKNIKNIQFIIAKTTQVDWAIYNRKVAGFNIDLKIIEEKTYDCLNVADFCLVTSGTATIETAIMQKPFVVIYKINLLNYLLYRLQVKVPYIGMVNIVAKEKIIPEFIQFQATPENIASEVVRILNDPSKIQQIKSHLTQIKSLLGEPGASLRAAQIVKTFLNPEEKHF